MQSLGESERLFYKVREKPYNDSPAKGYILQEYVAQDNGMAKQGDILCTGTMEKCRELLRKMETGELTQGDVKELYAKEQEEQGYSYVRPTEQLRESVKIAETIYFSVPEDYDFTLKRSRSDGQGGFVTEELKVTVNELKERHKKYDDTPDFVKISISAKRVVSSFTSTKSGEPVEYCKIMAPEGMTYIRKKEQSATFFQNKAVRLIIKNSLLSVNLGENFYIDICKTKDI